MAGCRGLGVEFWSFIKDNECFHQLSDRADSQEEQCSMNSVAYTFNTPVNYACTAVSIYF